MNRGLVSIMAKNGTGIATGIERKFGLYEMLLQPSQNSIETLVSHVLIS